MDHRLAAAQHARTAALHLGATDDRCGYWRLLGEAELCVGRPAELYLQMATRYSLGLAGNDPDPAGCPVGV